VASTRLELNALDFGRKLTLSEFDEAEFAPGFHYEIIEGKLYVSPQSTLPEYILQMWMRDKLIQYGRSCPSVIGSVAEKARVFVADCKRATVPEPDLAIYAPFEYKSIRELRWQDHSPFLIVEVLVGGSIHKDMTRNAELYLRLKPIREYWILNGSESPDEPTLIVHTRRGKSWTVAHYPYGSTYATKLLPGFSLLIDPRK